MPLTLVAGPGLPNANAYATVAEADAFLSYRLGSGSAAWAALTADQRIQALVTATRDIDTLESDPGFVGAERTDEDQSLAWPRDGEVTLPGDLVSATIELALSYTPLVAAGAADPLNTDAQNGNIKKEVVGPLETEYFAAKEGLQTGLERFPSMVQRYLAGLVRSTENAGWGSAVVTRGS